VVTADWIREYQTFDSMSHEACEQEATKLCAQEYWLPLASFFIVCVSLLVLLVVSAFGTTHIVFVILTLLLAPLLLFANFIFLLTKQIRFRAYSLKKSFIILYFY
jgi:hypothetical protein